MLYIKYLLTSRTLNPMYIGLSSVKTDLISWTATNVLLNNFCKTKLGLLTYFYDL